MKILQRNTSQIAGIVGGLGPAASNLLASTITTHVHAERDQDHAPFVLLNNPQTPDRTKYLINDGADPAPAIIRTVKQLARAGATYACIPCNTAHAEPILGRVRKRSPIPILSMIDLTIDRIKKTTQASGKILVLATEGTLQSGVYKQSLESQGIQEIVPSKSDRSAVMDVIYGIKGGDNPAIHNATIEKIIAKHTNSDAIDGVILGCTELSLLSNLADSTPLYDPLDLLAREIADVHTSQQQLQQFDSRLGRAMRRPMSPALLNQRGRDFMKAISRTSDA